MQTNDSISTIHKVGPRLTKQLANLSINTIQDLLLYLPYKYLDFSKFTTIAAIVPGEVVTVRGTIKTIQSRFSFKTRKALCEAIISDSTGSIKVTWFNQSYLAKTLASGDEVLLSGKAEQYKGLQLLNPVHEKLTSETIHTGRLVPVYRLPSDVYNRTFRGFIKQALPHANKLADIIPSEVRNEFKILPVTEAITQLHFPSNTQILEQAKLRMIFEEVFIQQLAVEQHKLMLKKLAAPSIKPNIDLIKKFLGTLPFQLTDGQKKALWQILQDLEHKHPMNRLLQGDVGSGKTLVALATTLNVVDAGLQVALLAPTEILARQHYESFKMRLKTFHSPGQGGRKLRVGLLTRNFHEMDGVNVTKKDFLKQLSAGKINILIGTHAVLQSTVNFKNLALVIIDEQHRFGVKQRGLLLKTTTSGYPTPFSDGRQKKEYGNNQRTSHLLSMSATPIPRTLALSIYSDLEVSTLTELPRGRQTIITKIIAENSRQEAYNFIKKEILAGRQAFVITPLVEESEKIQIKSVKAEFERLRKEVFQDFTVGLVYGSMKGSDKDAAMNAFANKEYNILIATSVIEIGIDIPNATVMVIEGADRFGLAQLHQLRGRVGRGKHQSYCMLFTDTLNEKTLERLNFFASSNDGFKLAQVDLEQRGFGSLFGQEQTGFNFKFSKYLTLQVLETAKRAASELTTKYPDLQTYPMLKEKVSPLLNAIHLE